MSWEPPANIATPWFSTSQVRRHNTTLLKSWSTIYFSLTDQIPYKVVFFPLCQMLKNKAIPEQSSVHILEEKSSSHSPLLLYYTLKPHCLDTHFRQPATTVTATKNTYQRNTEILIQSCCWTSVVSAQSFGCRKANKQDVWTICHGPVRTQVWETHLSYQ